MDPLYVQGAVAIPTIFGIVEALQKVGLPSRFVPVSALGVGVALELFQVYSHTLSLPAAVMTGLSLGLSAVGADGGVKATVAKRVTKAQPKVIAKAAPKPTVTPLVRPTSEPQA